MAMQEPQLKDQVESRTSRETFQRRLSYYFTGLLIGLVLLLLILSARRSARQNQQPAPPADAAPPPQLPQP